MCMLDLWVKTKMKAYPNHVDGKNDIPKYRGVNSHRLVLFPSEFLQQSWRMAAIQLIRPEGHIVRLHAVNVSAKVIVGASFAVFDLNQLEVVISIESIGNLTTAIMPYLAPLGCFLTIKQLQAIGL